MQAKLHQLPIRTPASPNLQQSGGQATGYLQGYRRRGRCSWPRTTSVSSMSTAPPYHYYTVTQFNVLAPISEAFTGSCSFLSCVGAAAAATAFLRWVTLTRDTEGIPLGQIQPAGSCRDTVSLQDTMYSKVPVFPTSVCGHYCHVVMTIRYVYKFVIVYQGRPSTKRLG